MTTMISPRRDRRHHLHARCTAGLAFSVRTTRATPQATAHDPPIWSSRTARSSPSRTVRREAQAVASRGGRIVAIGTAAEMKAHIGPKTEVIDVKGQLVIPGFIEGHGHFTGVGAAQLNLNLMNTKSWDQIVAMVAEQVKTAKPGEWIYGRGWHQEKWTARPNPNVEGFPDPRVAQQGLAEQPRRAHARERPRQLRQCQSDGALRRDRQDARTRPAATSSRMRAATRPGCFARPPRA